MRVAYRQHWVPNCLLGVGAALVADGKLSKADDPDLKEPNKPRIHFG